MVTGKYGAAIHSSPRWCVLVILDVGSGLKSKEHVMEMKSKSAFVLRLAALSILFEFLFLSAALMLTWGQPSWIGFFSNLFLTSILALALLFGSMIFGTGTNRQQGLTEFRFAQFRLDGSQVGRLALWLSTVVAFFGSMISALIFMN
jgi:hypothetical protein